MRIDPRSILAPIFWIIATFLTMTYSPVIFARLKGDIKPEEIKQKLVERSPEPIKAILGKETESSPDNAASPSIKLPQTPQQVPEYIREVIEKTTKEIIEKSSSQVQETKQQTTTAVCQQIITEVQKQCGIE